jgi:hypothetical protein
MDEHDKRDAGSSLLGGCAGQGGAPISGDQALVRIYKGLLSRLEEKQGTALHAVCAVQSVDGAREIDGVRRMNVPENRAMALQGVQKTLVGCENDQRVFVSDISKASKLIGWQPEVSSREGVTRMFEWVQRDHNDQQGFTRLDSSYFQAA